MEVFSNEYVQFVYLPNEKMIEHHWKIETQNAKWEKLQDSFYALGKLYNQYQPNKAFIDTRNFAFTIDPHQQTWIDENVNKPAAKAGLQKAAMIIPEEFFASISVQQTMEEQNAKTVQIKYFSDEELAKKWLME